jgi:hypothetical protein
MKGSRLPGPGYPRCLLVEQDAMGDGPLTVSSSTAGAPPHGARRAGVSRDPVRDRVGPVLRVQRAMCG